MLSGCCRAGQYSGKPTLRNGLYGRYILSVRSGIQLFADRDLVYAALVSASFELRPEIGFENRRGLVVGDEPRRQYTNVGIVVLFGQGGDFGGPAQGGPNRLMLVEGHADSVPAAAHRYPEINFTGLHPPGQKVGVIGIVATLFAVAAVVENFVTAGSEPADQILFELIACVVGGNTNLFHDV